MMRRPRAGTVGPMMTMAIAAGTTTMIAGITTIAGGEEGGEGWRGEGGGGEATSTNSAVTGGLQKDLGQGG